MSIYLLCVPKIRNLVSCSIIIIGVGRFIILGEGGGGQGGEGANSQQAHDVVTTSCAH